MMLFMSVLLPLPLVRAAPRFRRRPPEWITSSSTRTAPVAGMDARDGEAIDQIRLSTSHRGSRRRGGRRRFLPETSTTRRLGEAHHGTHDVLDEDDGDAGSLSRISSATNVVDSEWRALPSPHRPIRSFGSVAMARASFQLRMSTGEIARQVSRAVGRGPRGQQSSQRRSDSDSASGWRRALTV